MEILKQQTDREGYRQTDRRSDRKEIIFAALCLFYIYCQEEDDNMGILRADFLRVGGVRGN